MQTITKEEFKIVGLDCETSVQQCKEVLPQLWEKLMQRFQEIKETIDEKTMYGVCYEGKGNNFRYIAAVKVKDFKELPEGMVKETMPASKYAKFTHKGKIDKIGETYYQIENQLKKEGIREKGIWIEIYDERFKDGQEDSETDILVMI